MDKYSGSIKNVFSTFLDSYLGHGRANSCFLRNSLIAISAPASSRQSDSQALLCLFKAVDVIKDVVVDRQSSRSVTVSPTYP
ncbi:hypothetical protein OUZ56_013254 [Daphnia magna]|uniref:Uncharacterized protein n=1 Tax=Daphnia magna TaxID=35525 RepID=A0ABQ9Z5C6_9CRUS|nr:hypothetical protein OUZ56_013254 [Daphnia magna]